VLAAINYHYIRQSFNYPYSGIHGITPKQFEAQLKTLSGYTKFIPQLALKKMIQEKNELTQKVSMITFDDGLKEQYVSALPVLDKLNIPAVFYVNTRTIVEPIVLNVHKIHILRSRISPEIFKNKLKEFIEERKLDVDFSVALIKGEQHYKYDKGEAARVKYILNFLLDQSRQDDFIDLMFETMIEESEAEISAKLYMDKSEVKSLANKGYLGSHTHDHNPVGLLNEDEKVFQISESKKILEKITGQEIYSLSYPYGSKASCENLAPMLENLGYSFALTMERALNEDISNPYYLSRFDNNDMPMGKSYEFESKDFYKYYSKSSWWN